MERGGGDLSIGTLALKLYYRYLSLSELRVLRRLPAASMLPAGSRRAAPEGEAAATAYSTHHGCV